MRIRDLAATVATAIVSMIVCCGCVTEPQSGHTGTTTSPRLPNSFDPCTDLSRDFLAKYHLENKVRSTYRSGLFGGDAAAGCSYEDPDRMEVDIAVTSAVTGTYRLYRDTVSAETHIGGRKAVIAGPGSPRTQGAAGHPMLIEQCFLMTEISGGSLHLSFTGYSEEFWFDSSRSCAALTEFATELVSLLPPGS